MKNMVNLFANLASEKEGFAFGEAWRLSDKHVGALVPILRDRTFPRDYIIFEELKTNDYVIEDTGKIDEVLFKNLSSIAVFIRAGTLFKGISTQTRSAESSVVVDANSKLIIKARCVHESHPISGGAAFVAGGYAPSSVTASLCSMGGQSAVWNKVRSFTSSSGSTAHDYQANYAKDDLYSHIQHQKASNDVKDFIKEMPLSKNQIGVVILDETGVYAVEFFDHPLSWKEFRENVALTYSEIVNKKTDGKIFDVVFRQDMIQPLIRSFLLGLETGTANKANDNTTMISSKTVSGEFTEYYNRVVHVLGFRRE